jgi:hypothetical protein
MAQCAQWPRLLSATHTHCIIRHKKTSASVVLVCSLGVALAGMDGRLTHACRSCGVLVCRTCCVDDHLTKGHSAVPVDTAATEAAKAIAAAMPSLRTCTCVAA